MFNTDINNPIITLSQIILDRLNIEQNLNSDYFLMSDNNGQLFWGDNSGDNIIPIDNKILQRVISDEILLPLCDYRHSQLS